MKYLLILMILILQGCFNGYNNDLKHETINDTGIDTCSENFGVNPSSWTSGLTCALVDWSANTWGKQQDGFYGRDALAMRGELSKIGSGLAGFDYTRMNHFGQALALQNVAWNENGTEESGEIWDCVRDNVTGLWWEVKRENPVDLRYKGHLYTWFNSNSTTNGGDAGTAAGGSCVGVADPAFCNTKSYVAAVNRTSLCGYNDWRLPAIEELMSLTNRGRSTGLGIDTNYFPNTPIDWTWSSTPDVTCPTCAWDISFNIPDLFDNIDHKNSAYSVFLVRGTPIQYTSNNRFNSLVTSNDAEVFDSLTGLIWQRCVSGMTWNGTTCLGVENTYTWQEALSHAETISNSNQDAKKWRLPNVVELYTLADRTRNMPAFNTQWFPQTPAASTWTSSHNVQIADQAWFVNFSVGYSGTDSVNVAHPIRMVRNK